MDSKTISLIAATIFSIGALVVTYNQKSSLKSQADVIKIGNLDYGDVRAKDDVKALVKVQNIGSQEVRLVGASVCCTALKFPRVGRQ